MLQTSQEVESKPEFRLRGRPSSHRQSLDGSCAFSRVVSLGLYADWSGATGHVPQMDLV